MYLHLSWRASLRRRVTKKKLLTVFTSKCIKCQLLPVQMNTRTTIIPSLSITNNKTVDLKGFKHVRANAASEPSVDIQICVFAGCTHTTISQLRRRTGGGWLWPGRPIAGWMKPAGVAGPVTSKLMGDSSLVYSRLSLIHLRVSSQGVLSCKK